VRKIIREILVLLWKAFRLVLWAWLKPLLRRFMLYVVLAAGFVAVLVYVVMNR
jgi:hypothetical protein